MNIAISQCSNCQWEWVGEKQYCPKCLSDDYVIIESDGVGTVYSHTIIHAAPDKYKNLAPYTIALVDMTEKIRLSTRSLNESISIGDTVQITEIKNGAYIVDKVES
ncbi:Zn-ribbon domain-containing OB-fold protein [Oceanobacillus jeddahense]|uniref:OB-fold domain-containing protein n=1 Tax=Oceanobacillus jeddahense TaxID=1462527 RepID=A0ABY5JWX5_9BACI|nr:OB-fold domain-containing protein [Oceanobacillus jeddahense]UUI03069.1 OB-fold domain-containing protein [Oceanobacillus jeddahense]